MRSLPRRTLCSLLLLVGCSGPPPELPEGPIAREVDALSVELAVPRDLVVAIARVEGGLLLPRRRVVRPDDDVPVAGILELRHGAFNSLARGAALLGTDEETLRADTDLGTEAGVRVLAELGARTGARAGDLASWRPAVAELSGLAGDERDRYLAAVFSTLRAGGAFPARDGEVVEIAPHPEVPAPAPPPLSEALGNPPPDFAGAIWLSTDCNANGGKCTAGRPDGNAAVNAIVIHDTEGGWAASVSTLQFDGGKSVHYLVDADGSRVGQFLHETDTAWHAGNWCWNKHSIGIEHVGVASDPTGYSDGLYDTSAKLVRDIRSRWPNVPLDRGHIVGHYQIPNGNQIPECNAACSDTLDSCEKSANYGGANNHRDPGYYWQWCQYFQKLGGHCACNDAWSLWNCTTDKTEAVRCHNGAVEIVACSPCESKPIGQDDVCHAPADAGAPPRADMTAGVADLSPLQLDGAPDLAEAADDLAAPPPLDAAARVDAAAPADLASTGDVVAPPPPPPAGCQCAVGSGRSHDARAAWFATLMIAALLARRRSR